jgi:hypothetical protein
MIGELISNNMKNTIIQNFQSRSEAFDWVLECIQNATIGDIKTTEQFRDNDAIIGETEEIIYVGLYNLNENDI